MQTFTGRESRDRNGPVPTHRPGASDYEPSRADQAHGTGGNGNAAHGRPEAGPGGIAGFVSDHPTLAIAAAVTLGLGMALALQPRRRERFDRRAMRAGRDFERRLTRELRSLRNSETADRIAGGIGGMLSSVDLSGLLQHGQAYLDSLRRRVR
jgi:hypothetical protein